jgi:hypothetical protein
MWLWTSPVNVRPARWPTVAGLSWAAAALTAVLALGGMVLAALGPDVSIFLLPAPLAYAWMGCVLLARRPGHPMGPLLCLIGLADAFATVPYTYVRYALVHSPGSLPFSTAALWINNWAYAPATSLGGMVLLLVFPDGRLLSRRFRPALWARWRSSRWPSPVRLLPAGPGPAVPPPAQPVRHPPARLALRDVRGPGYRVRCRRGGGRGGERDTALAPGRPGRTPAAQVAAGHAAVHHCLAGRHPVFPGTGAWSWRCRPAS